MENLAEKKKSNNVAPVKTQVLKTWVFLFLVIGVISQGTGAFALQASYYSNASLIKEGTWKNGVERRMANGEKFNEEAFTCATRLYPLGTHLRIRNNGNGKSVVVKVTDRISKRFAKTRIDLSKRAFGELTGNQWALGLVPITVEVVND